jgi:hypothetical protein
MYMEQLVDYVAKGQARVPSVQEQMVHLWLEAII